MIIRELKGGSLSKTVVVEENGERRVRKYCSYTEAREFGLVRWHSQIRKLQYLHSFLGYNVCEILALGVEGELFYYEIPFYAEAIDCSEYLNGSGDDRELLDQLVLLIKRMGNVRFGDVSGSIAVYLTEEVLVRLEGALSGLEDGSFTEMADPKGFADRIRASISHIKDAIHEYSDRPLPETLCHGNLTLENMLWDPEHKRLILIDAYSESYAETLIGDVSQIAQSTLSGYEYVLKHNMISDPSTLPYPINKVPYNIKKFGHELIERLSSEPFNDSNLLDLMHASQFIRMFPFKAHHNKLSAYFFLQRGIEIIEGKTDA